jgi:fructose PTS system EIIBC or EIIC component
MSIDWITQQLPFGGPMEPLLILSVILIVGLAGGWAARLCRIPSITGNILAGIFIGPACLNIFGGEDVAASLKPLSSFAMGLITVAVGSQLSYQSIHNALRRIITIAMCEVAGAVILVTLASRLVGADWPTAFVLGCIAAATAPATTIALVRETRSKGPFVKTLLSVVALDNMLCIMLFAFSSTLMADIYESGDGSLVYALFHTAYQFCGAFLLGIGLGMATERIVHKQNIHDFSAVFIAILLSVGLSSYFDLSYLMTSLFFGVYLGNASPEATRQTRTLEPIELLLFICFFTLAGVSLHLDTIAEAGALCAVYLVARFVGKYLGASLGGVLSRSSRRIWTNAGLGLVPQAGVAIGLVFVLNNEPAIPEEVSSLITTLVLGAVTVNEIIGPLFTKMALARAGEVNKDRRRLIEFLQEEFIIVGLRGKDKWEVLRKLTDFYLRTHRVPAEDHDLLYKTIENRERELTTAVGLGAAIPHGRVHRGGGIQGVLGICREGVEFGAADGEPVRILMLVVTPEGYNREHLEVMASLAQMISEEQIRTRLVAAINANDAWEVIEGEEARNYNYFLEEDEARSD